MRVESDSSLIMRKIADEILENAELLEEQWLPKSGTCGTGTKLDIVYALERAITHIYNVKKRLSTEAMSELDKFVKERKLC